VSNSYLALGLALLTIIIITEFLRIARWNNAQESGKIVFKICAKFPLDKFAARVYN